MIKIKIDLDLKARLAAASKAAVDARKQELVEALRKATPVDTGEARDGWRLEGSAIVNGVAHITKLNAGGSKQAPSYFIEKTLLSEPGVIPNGTVVRST
jgi:hypothetical protein